MLIASPVSHLFFDKFKAKKIIKVSDCLETRDKTINLSFKKEYLFHCDKSLTHPWGNNFKSNLKNILKKKKKLKLISFQNTTCCENELLVNGIFQSSGKFYSENQMLKFSSQNVNWLRKQNNNIKIAVENNNYYPTRAYNIITNANFIKKIVEKNDIYFLLDIAHSMITAFNKRINFEKYLNSLPLDKTIQIHICKSSFNKKKTMALDSHFLPDNNIFNIVANLLRQYKQIEYLTIEYYKNADNLVSSIKKLKNFLKKNVR